VQCHAQLPQPAYQLTAEGGRLAGGVFSIPADGLTVGRAQDQNTLVISDPGVSRRHATLTLEGGSVRLLDMGTPNGTYVNEIRVTTAILKEGDRVRFGAGDQNVFVLRGATSVRPAAQPTAPATSRSTIFMSATDAAMEETGGELPSRRLQLVLDQYAVRDIELNTPRLEIGRAVGSGPGRLELNHPSISAHHAELLNTPSHAILRDLGSTAGSYVNGEKVTERILGEGDMLRFGSFSSHVFLFRESRPRVALLRDVELNAPVVSIGRSSDNSIRLEHPTVSSHHAEIRRQPDGYELVDLNSTNGTFINGEKISRHRLQPQDRIALGAVQFIFDGAQMEQQSDGTHIRLTAQELRVEAKDFNTGQPIRLLDDVSMIVEPREFVGLLGPSGAGKSTLMDALNGARPAQKGCVHLNAANLYDEFDSLRALIGYLPQEDILHRQLTVRECLYYSARLRLPDDFGEKEIHARVSEVMQMLDLTERAGTAIAQLSGGQRKRVSLGIELLSKPALLFVDEPTAGQDPRTEMKMMQLFREIANRGSTVIINTHLLGSFSLLDKVAVLVRGKLAYYGGSQQMLPYFEARRPHEIYDKLQEHKPEEWAARYKRSPEYQKNVASGMGADGSGQRAEKSSTPASKRHSSLRQLSTLLSRQFALKSKDKAALMALLLPPIIIGILMGFMKQSVNEPKTLFMIVLVALWFGCSSTVREIVDELPVFRRERQRELKLFSYLGAKVIYLLILAAVQSLPFILILTVMGALENHLLEAFLLTWIMTIEGGLIGLLISAVFSSAEKALYAFPLTMIPQLLLAGLLMPVHPIHPFVPALTPDHHVMVREIPMDMMQPAMSPLLSKGLSPFMVARWGLEGLTDLYIHDLGDDATKGYPYMLLSSVSVTLHPGEDVQVRNELAAVKDVTELSNGIHKTPSAFGEYLLILGAFAVFMLGATAIALWGKGSHAS
jgi:ABC-type multidrug transport system ATPase subunit